MSEAKSKVDESVLSDLLCDSLPPVGANYIDNGPSSCKWLRINEAVHDYWCCIGRRWVTFESGHNHIREHWLPIQST